MTKTNLVKMLKVFACKPKDKHLFKKWFFKILRQ